MDKDKMIHGIQIPQSLINQDKRAIAYIAGYVFSRKNKKIDKVPNDLKEICSKYGKDISHSNLEYPAISREESSFWAGYLTEQSDSRDRTRSDSKESNARDLGDSMGDLRSGRRSLRKELEDLFHIDDE
jgi:hypothetical protein